MKQSKCVHPKKVKRLMKEFVNEISPIYYLTEDDTYEKTKILVKQDSYFSAESIDSTLEWEELTITYNFDELWDESAKLFRAYWSKRYPLTKGFADITISLLHELSHLIVNDEIRKTFSYEDRALAMSAIDIQAQNYEEKCNLYFGMPDEKAATEWGLNWLAIHENAKKAKAFEKEFFKCFE